MNIIDTSVHLDAVKGHGASQRGLSRVAQSLIQSEILSIANEIRALIQKGTKILNLTVGDFSSAEFPIPEVLKNHIKTALDEGHSNYPPSSGLLETRQAVQVLFKEHLGLSYPIESVLITSGARPAIAGTYMTLVNPGDAVLYSLPSWNNNHYCTLIGAEAIEVPTTADAGFFPKVDDLKAHLPRARLVVLNTPLNPTGTVMDAGELERLSRAILEENHRRAKNGEAALYLMFDQVYWMLTFRDVQHANPVSLVPEMAAYTIFVDGLSKGFAATGLRVGWAVGPPDVIGKMSAVLTHVGAWAPRPEQVATAKLLVDRPSIDAFRAQMTEELLARLGRLKNGIDALRGEGHDVEAIAPQGAIYLSIKLGIANKKTASGAVLRTDEDIRRYLLSEAQIGLVPFVAFGLPAGSGWFRASVGAVSKQQCDEVVVRLRAALSKLS